MRNSLLVALLLVSAVPVAAQAQALNPARTGATYAREPVQTGYKWFDDRKSVERKNPDGTLAERPNFCDGCTFKDMTLKPGRYGLEITRSRDILVENMLIEQPKPTTKEGDLPGGIKVSGGVGPLIVRNTTLKGFKRDWPAADYGQGDGLDCDARAFRLELHDVRFLDNYDGGLDTKCDTVGDKLLSERNYRNFRFWGKFQIGTARSVDPRDDNFWFSNGADGIIERAEIVGQGGKTAFYFDDAGAEPYVNFCYANTVNPVKAFGGRVPKDVLMRFHSSCHPDAKGYLVNTIVEVPDPVGDVYSKAKLEDKDKDGFVTVSTTAKTLGVPKGTILRYVDVTKAGLFAYVIVPKS